MSLTWKNINRAGYEKSQTQGSLSRTVHLAQRQSGRCYFVSTCFCNTPPRSQDFFCRILVTASLGIYPVISFLGLLFAYGGRPSGGNPKLPQPADKNVHFTPQRQQKDKKYPGLPLPEEAGLPGPTDRTSLESAPFHPCCCFDLTLTLFTRTGSS